VTIARRINALAWNVVASGWKAFARLSSPRERAVTQGIRVLDTLEEPAPDELVAKVADALDLIAAVDPRRLRRLRLDVDAIALIEWSGSRRVAAHMPRSRSCYIRISVARTYSVGTMATIIAHEGTHARLDRLRIVSWWGVLQHRVEHRCLREELAIAERLPQRRYPDTEAWIADRWTTSRFAPKPLRAGQEARRVRAT
jgi:hypothetical protein